MIYGHRVTYIVNNPDVPTNLLRFAQGLADNARIDSGGNLQLRNSDTGKFHDLAAADGANGVVTATIDTVGET